MKPIRQIPRVALVVMCDCGAVMGEDNPDKAKQWKLGLLPTIKCEKCKAVIELAID